MTAQCCRMPRIMRTFKVYKNRGMLFRDLDQEIGVYNCISAFTFAALTQLRLCQLACTRPRLIMIKTRPRVA